MAIPSETAREWAARHDSPESLRKAVKDRLLAAQPHPVGDGRLEEYPEDVVIALLEDESLPDEQRRAIVSGWREACTNASLLLTSDELDANEREKLRIPFTRVFRVPAVTGHPDLRRSVRQALPNALSSDALITKGQVQEVVLAARAYPDVVDRGQWRTALQEKPELAAHAFRVLLEIDHDSPRAIVGYFLELLRKQFVEKEELNCGFLAAFVPRKVRDGDKVLSDAITQFADEYPDAFQSLREDISNNKCWPGTVRFWAHWLAHSADSSSMDRKRLTQAVRIYAKSGLLVTKQDSASTRATAYRLLFGPPSPQKSIPECLEALLHDDLLPSPSSRLGAPSQAAQCASHTEVWNPERIVLHLIQEHNEHTGETEWRNQGPQPALQI